MACPYFDRLREILWPSSGDRPQGEVYALLDAARDPRIHPTLKRSLADSCCLYSGTLPRPIEEVAPYLVALARDSGFTRRLLDMTWDHGAAVLLRSPAILQDLRRHFRRFLTVNDEMGRRLIFRFYDPRVFRLYLPTCNPQELGPFFGPVERFLVEGATPGEAIEFRRSASGLEQDVIALSRSIIGSGPDGFRRS